MNQRYPSFLRQPQRRRDFLKMLGAFGIGVSVTPYLSNGAKAADEAIYFTWGGYEDPGSGIFKVYEDEFGALPQFATYGDAEEGLQKLRAGFTADVIHPCATELVRWKDAGVLQPIDTGRLKNWPALFQTLRDLPLINLEGKVWMAPWEWGSTSITYRTDLVELPNGEESWGILWDEKNKGRIAVIDSAEDTWFCAAIYAGIPLDKIDAAAMDKVKALLVKQRPLIRMYSSDNTVQEQALASGELVAAMTWADAANNLIKQGQPVKFAQPKEGPLTWVCGLVLHKDAPHLDKAYAFIDSMLAASTGKACIDYFGYGHSNPKAFEGFTKERLAQIGIVGTPEQTLSAGHLSPPQTPETWKRIFQDWEQVKAGF
ncbi:spermidine/putrescine transport system substrate-binding protein [Rhodoligotrophos appendicifer]|uniref:ABC transporter substrate-binding protein n=1 Tax=Rhodoligotrophos appendicifer TaxID=987056 RepID=UPI00196188DC|nr:extracellular solute-binding protein [Rhodoligotrophos appendicifer]